MIRNNIELAISVNKRGMISGWIALEAPVSGPITLYTEDGMKIESITKWVDRPDVRTHFRDVEKIRVIEYGFIVLFDHGPGRMRLAIGEQRIDLFCRQHIIAEDFHHIFYIQSDLERVSREIDGPSFVDIALKICRREVHRQGFVPGDIQDLYAAIDLNNRILESVSSISGWIACHSSTDPVVIVELNSGEFISGQDKCARSPRPDVAKFFLDRGEVISACFGFNIALETPNKTLPQRIHIISHQNYVCIDIGEPKTEPPLKEAARIFEQESLDQEKKARNIAEILSPLAKARSMRNPDTSLVFDSTTGECDISVVIPIYGRWDFIKYHIPMFSKLVDSIPKFEVLYIVDDPGLVSAIRRYFTGMEEQLSFGLKIVANNYNVGYAGATNVGSRIARGRLLLLMNSDIYITESEMLRKGVALVENDDVGIVGFTLLYEDETIQHDGITLDQRKTYFGMMMPDHPRKGFPARVYIKEIEIKPSPIVSGALMLVNKEYYDSIGSMPEDYIVGDFEDVQLCNASAQVRQNWIVRGSEIYHLERQSLVKTGESKQRQAVLIRNAFHFWQSQR